MTLQEKFKQWFINDEEDEHYEGMVEQVAIAHEKIAEEFAIGFAEWLSKNDLYDEILLQVSEAKELLEIYKKERGL